MLAEFTELIFDRNLKCYACDYITNNPGNLKNHIFRHGTTGLYYCRFCNFSCNTRTLIYNHELDCHAIKNKIKKFSHCKYCGVAVSSKKNLTDHYAEKHKEERPFACEFCKFRTDQQRAIDRHMDTHNQNIYGCGICGNRFKSEIYLDTHRLKYHGI